MITTLLDDTSPAKDTARDFWLNTQAALDYGLLGQVISSISQLR